MGFGNVMGQGINLLNQYGNLVEVRVEPKPLAVGQKINFLENGVAKPYIVVHIGNPNPNIYDSSCDGIWMMRERVIGTATDRNVGARIFGNTVINTSFLQVDYFNTLDERLRAAIKEVKVPYYNAKTVFSKASGYSAKIIAGSPIEYGVKNTSSWPIPTDGAVLSYFSSPTGLEQKRSVINDSGNRVSWNTRTPLAENQQEAATAWHSFDNYGKIGQNAIITGPYSYYYRPMFILPKDYFSKKSLYTLDGQFIMDVPEA